MDKEKVELLKLLWDYRMKLILAFFSIFVFTGILLYFFLCTDSCTWDSRKWVFGAVEAILGGTFYKVMTHYFPVVNALKEED